jgi:hypothetical protein
MGLRGKDLTTNREIAEGFFRKEDDTNIFQNDNTFKVQVLTDLKDFAGPASASDDPDEISSTGKASRKWFIGRIKDNRMAHHNFLTHPCDESIVSDVELGSHLYALHTKIVLVGEDFESLSVGDTIEARCEAGDNNMLYDLQFMSFVKVVDHFETTVDAGASECEKLIELMEAWEGSSMGLGATISLDPTACDGDEFFLMHPMGANSAGSTSLFGVRIDPISGEQSNHPGIDFGGAEGAPVYAAADGTVTAVVGGCTRGPPEVAEGAPDPEKSERDAAYACGNRYGNHVFIRHEDGYMTNYAHLKDTPSVSSGDEVKQGDQIGVVGSTGYSTGPHLHFELYLNGGTEDPAPRIDTVEKCDSTTLAT